MDQAEIRVRGRVQGVGFRPAVWRLACELGLSGEVRNDAEGVLIRVAGQAEAISDLLDRLQRQPPPLAHIAGIERSAGPITGARGFRIVDSVAGCARTEVTPDAAICAACAREVLEPRRRRHSYSFATCTHCGPRFSIMSAVPYDRAATMMAGFPLCAACSGEYRDPADRRFHAEAIACPACGPRVRLVPPAEDAVETAAALLRDGRLLAIKGLGGYQLACDASNGAALARLRDAKRRPTKPFALMARDLDVIRRYCVVSPAEAQLLASPAAPIVLLESDSATLPEAVAPGVSTLGFMLPTTPLHLLLLRGIDRPLVMTSGNRSDSPQIIDDEQAFAALGPITDAVLTHDRAIAARVDDSVVRVVGGTARTLRRARGFAPAGLRLPEGFAVAPDLLAAGGEQKVTFGLLKSGTAILSPHIGDLDDARTLDDYRAGIAHLTRLFDHTPAAIACDPHPEYLSSKLARSSGLRLIEVQHHHAHVAACLAENGHPLASPPVLGIVLDGLGWGEDGSLWGGEFLLANYRDFRRLAALKPVAMPGGSAAAREPWRNLYAQLLGAGLDPAPLLADRPLPLLEAMIRGGVNAPLASSCGRLFDAIAAALGICSDRQHYEGEAAARLEALACSQTLRGEDDRLAYCLPLRREASFIQIDPGPMWHAVLRDLACGTASAVIAARFHKGLAMAVAATATALAETAEFDTVALSGGCLQNAILSDQVEHRLHRAGFSVLIHTATPANDGGLALGQAAVAAARLIAAS